MRVGVDPALRRPGQPLLVRPRRGLPRRLPRPAGPEPRAVVRGGRGLRRAVCLDRRGDGHRGRQAHHRLGAHPGQPAPRLRRARRELARADDPARPRPGARDASGGGRVRLRRARTRAPRGKRDRRRGVRRLPGPRRRAQSRRRRRPRTGRVGTRPHRRRAPRAQGRDPLRARRTPPRPADPPALRRRRPLRPGARPPARRRLHRRPPPPRRLHRLGVRPPPRSATAAAEPWGRRPLSDDGRVSGRRRPRGPRGRRRARPRERRGRRRPTGRCSPGGPRRRRRRRSPGPRRASCSP